MLPLKQWDAVKFNHIQTLEGHTDEISDIKISSNGRCLVCALIGYIKIQIKRL
jgi:WD40 repeat protein